MSAKHTPGPWRWEFNAKHKSVSLVGGIPTFDLTVVDFERWGMGGAVPSFRDTFESGMNTMYRLCDKPDWITPFPGRKHHAHWCADVIHPDARLIAAAPDLLAALQAGPSTEHALPLGNVCSCSQCEFVRLRRAAIAKAIG